MRRLRLVLWAVVALAAAGFGWLLWQSNDDRAGPSGLPQFTLDGPFTLQDSKGQAFSSATLAGKPYVLFFGFTHCPDVCPTTLARLARLREQLGTGPDSLRILFVTVDPERDGPAEVGKYAQLFNTPIVGLTGTPAQVQQVAKQYGIYAKNVPDGSGGYTMDHTAASLLFDGQGEFVATITPEEGDQVAIEKMRRAIVES